MRIGEREFDWQPTLYAGTEFTPLDHRGTDRRLDGPRTRLTAAERKEAKAARRRRPPAGAEELSADQGDIFDGSLDDSVDLDGYGAAGLLSGPSIEGSDAVDSSHARYPM